MLYKPDLTFTVDGGIQLEWHTLFDDLVIEFCKGGSYDYYYYRDGTEIEGQTTDTAIMWKYIQEVAEEEEDHEF